MKRTGTKPSRRLGSLLAGITTFALLTLLVPLGCVSSPITLEGSDAAPLARSATIHVVLAPRPEPAEARADGPIETAVDPALESALRDQAERSRPGAMRSARRPTATSSSSSSRACRRRPEKPGRAIPTRARRGW
jgi:hypothetical protein